MPAALYSEVKPFSIDGITQCGRVRSYDGYRYSAGIVGWLAHTGTIQGPLRTYCISISVGGRRNLVVAEGPHVCEPARKGYSTFSWRGIYSVPLTRYSYELGPTMSYVGPTDQYYMCPERSSSSSGDR